MAHARSLLGLAIVFAVAGGAVAGCGSDSGSSQLAKQEELRQARADASRQARQDERLKELQRQVDAAKKSGSSTSSSSGSNAAGSPAPSGATSGPVSCGGTLSVGSHTSCAFAQNVRDAYDRSGGGDTTVEASSPATGQTYSMRCSGGSPHVCIGGNSASVYWP
jgi:hypothetical protein